MVDSPVGSVSLQYLAVQGLVVCLRIVDKNIQLAASDFSDLLFAPLDARSIAHVQRDDAHARLSQLLENLGPAGGGDDMVPCISRLGHFGSFNPNSMVHAPFL